MKNIVSKIISAFLLLTIFSVSAFVQAAPNIEETKSARLRWKTETINIALSSSLSKFMPNIMLGSDVPGAVRRSLETWEKAANIKFNEIYSDKQSVSPAGIAGDGVNLITIAPTAENQIFFGEEAADISAKTRVFYNRRGFITEADIVLNPHVQFSTDGTIGTFDLEATLTHEIGHLLGLEHSNFCGSTMHLHQAKNGIYNLPQFASRTLSDSDIANVRALYGAPEGENCCGSVKGKLSLPSNAAASGFQVWLENAQNGKLHAGTVTQSDGSFSLEGLTPGKYRIFAQDTGEKQKNRKKIYAGDQIGEVTVENGKVVAFDKELTLRERTFSLKYVGFNHQISNVPVPVNGGKTFTIYVGGENLNAHDFQIFINSPHFKVTPKTITAPNFGDEISVLNFEIAVSSNVPRGEYSIVLQKSSGERAFLIGGLTGDAFVNPWHTALTNPIN
jgi:hypothetical protein